MAKNSGPNTRRATGTRQQVNQLIQSGAYDNAGINEAGAATVPYGRPAYGSPNMGGVRSAYDVNLPANTYGPQLPDLYASMNASAQGDEVSRMIDRDQGLYDANLAIASRQVGEGAPMPSDVADMYNNPRERYAAIPNDMIRQMLEQRLRQGGSQPPVPDNYTPRR
jgi:hypothetical protein